MRKALFNLGQIAINKIVLNRMNDNPMFAQEVGVAFQRHASGDWGDLCEEDKQMNDEGLKGDGRLYSAYDTSQGKLLIITEWNPSTTTILFPNEY